MRKKTLVGRISTPLFLAPLALSLAIACDSGYASEPACGPLAKLAFNPPKNLVGELMSPPGTRVEPYTRQHYSPPMNAPEGSDARMKTAVFPSGSYSPELDEELRKQGYFAVAILSPSDDEIRRHPEMLLAPEMIRTIMENPGSAHAWFESMPPGQTKAQMRKKLRTSGLVFEKEPAPPKPLKVKETVDGKEVTRYIPVEAPAWVMPNPTVAEDAPVRIEIRDLTPADYERWRLSLYEKEVATKRGAVPIWNHYNEDTEVNGVPRPSFLKMSKAEVIGEGPDAAIKNWKRAFAFDREGNLIGGSLVMIDPNEGSATVRAAAWTREADEVEAGTRAFYEVMLMAAAYERPPLEEGGEPRIGLPWISYGGDPNLYGTDSTLGLTRFKSGIGMQVIPHPAPTLSWQLYKVLDSGLEQIGGRAPEGRQDPSLVLFAAGGTGDPEGRIAARNAIDAAKANGLPSVIAESNAALVPVQLILTEGTNGVNVPWGSVPLQQRLIGTP